MSTKTLVTYATKHGATAEIAQKVGDVMCESGLDVDVLDVEAEPQIEAYDAIVLGSAVYAGMWRKEAVAFLERNEATLAQKPVWIFSSGPTGEGNASDLLDGWTFPEGQQEIADRIQPRDVAVFHGKIDMDTLNFPEKLIVKAVGGKVGDFRDWDAVTAWAAGIAQALSVETR